MKKYGKLVSLALAAAMVVSLAGCGQAQSSSATQSGEVKEFKVGMECNYAPFNWTQTDDSNGAVAIQGGGFAGGYDVQIAKKVAEGLGRKLVIVKTAWDGLGPAANSGVIDAIIAGMSPLAERKASIDFTDKYYTSDLVIVVRKDGKYANAKSLQDFKGAKITGQLSTYHYTVIDQIEGVSKQTAMKDFPTMITALSSGVIDGYISERPGALSAQASNPDLTFVAFDEGKGFKTGDHETDICVGLKKGSDLVDSINKILAKIPDSDRKTIMDNAVRNQPVAK